MVVVDENVGDGCEEAVSDWVELGDAEAEPAPLCIPVKLPPGLPDGVPLLEAGGVWLWGPLKLCRLLEDGCEEPVSDCVELGDTEAEPVRLCGEEDIVALGHPEVVGEREEAGLYVLAEGDASAVKLRVTDPLRVPLLVDDA